MTEKDKDFLEGLAISAACHVLPARKVFREPIAYSYNGTILPKLPESELPYAFMKYTPSGVAVKDAVYLYFLKDTVYKYEDGRPYLNVVSDCVAYRGTSSGWTEHTISADTEWICVDAVYLNTWESPVWSNFDIIGEDGYVYFTASEPVPVYE